MSKYATGIYSSAPADWSSADRVGCVPMAQDRVARGDEPFERATVESYTINHGKTGSNAVFIGRDPAGRRVVGNADLSHDATREAFEGGEPFGVRLAVTRDTNGRDIGRIEPEPPA